MITIGEAIQRVQSPYSKGVQSQSSRLTDRHIYSCLKTARGTIVRQMSNKKQFIPDSTYQPLDCVELISAAIHECPCVPSNGCTILRTKYKLPDVISDLDGNMPRYVMSLDSGIKFDPTTFERAKYMLGSKYTANKPRYFKKNGYMYVTTLTLLKVITISDLFDDPIEAHQFPSLCDCSGCACRSILDMTFPVDGSMLDAVIKVASNEALILFSQMKEDRNSNSRDDIQDSGNMVHGQQQPQEQ